MLHHFRTCAVATFLLPLQPAWADAQAPALSPAEAAFAARLVDARCLSSTPGHSACDRALLLQSETLDGMADLLILPAEQDTAPIIARDITRHGRQPDDAATLEQGPDGTFLIRSQETSHGRYPWFETLALTTRSDVYVVVGYHYSTYDRAMGGDFACWVDLLTGEWRAMGLRVDPESGAETASWDVTETGYADATDAIWWSYREPPAHCDDLLAQWFDAAP